MKKLEGGIEKTIDNLGRVVLPIDYRRKFGLDKNPEVKIFLRDEGIYITALNQGCVICKRYEPIDSELKICAECISKIKNMY